MVNHSLFNNISNLLAQGCKIPLVFKSISVSGNDALRFIQGQITNDLKNIADGEFIAACLLDHAGRISSHFYIGSEEKNFKIVALPFFIDDIVERLDKYLIADDVVMEVSSEEYDGILILPHLAKESRFTGKLFNLPASFIPKNSGSYQQIENELFNQIVFFSGESLVKEQIQNALLNDTIYVDTCVSFQKGCYLGQETVAKIESRRGSAKKWSCLELERLSEVLQTVSIEGKELPILSAISNEKQTLIKIPLKREMRVEGKKILVNVANKPIEARVRYFPIEIWNLEKWKEDKYLEAVEQFHKDNNNQAKEILKLLIQVQPGFEDAYESLGVILGREENFEEAIGYLKALEEINPDSVLVHTNLSLNYMKLGQIELAEEHKAQATVKSFESFGKEAQLKKQEQEKAQENAQREAMFNEVLGIDPEDALANYGLGEINADRGNLEKAKNYLEKAIQSDEKYSLAYLKLAEVHVGLGDSRQAQTLLEKGINIAASAGNLVPANKMQALLDQIKP